MCVQLTAMRVFRSLGEGDVGLVEEFYGRPCTVGVW